MRAAMLIVLFTWVGCFVFLVWLFSHGEPGGIE
jgi:hypothetical protein